MNPLSPFNFNKRPVIVGAAVFIILLALTQTLTYQRYLLRRNAHQLEVENHADLVKERIESVVGTARATTQMLGFLIEKNGVPKDFNHVAKTLKEDNKNIDAIELVEGGVITHVYPFKGNEKIIGYNILRDTNVSKSATIAIKNKEFFLAGPIKLKQGGSGFVGRWPIFRNNKFWGFSAVVIKLPTLLTASGIDTSLSHGYSYQLAKVDPETRKEDFFLSQKASLENEYFTTVEIPNGEWKLYVIPIESPDFLAVVGFAVIGLILAITGGLFAWFFVGQPEKLNSLVSEKTLLLTHERNLSDSVINSMPGIFYMAGTDGRLLRWNKNFEQITGYTTEEIGTMRVRDFIEASQLEAIFRKKQLAFEEGSSSIETIVLTKDKTEIPYYFTGLFTFYNEVPCVVGIGVDISNQKKAERQIANEKNLSESILKSLPGLFYMSDVNGSLLRWNENFELVSGYSGSEISNMRVRQFADAGEKEILRQKKKEVLEEGRAASEINFLTKNNVIIPYYFTSVLTHYNGQASMLGIGFDISGLKKAERQIVIERNLSDSIINSLPGVFYLYDERGKFLRWNKNFETVSGYSSSEIENMHPLDFFEGSNKALIEERIRKVFTEGEAYVEAEFIAKTGERKPYFFTGTAISYQGKPCLIGVGVDVAGKKKAEDALSASEEKYRYLFNNNPAFITIWDPQTLKVLEVNDRVHELYGLSREEYLKLDILQYRSPEDREKVRESAQLIAASGETKYRSVGRHLNKKGEVMYLDITSHIIEYNNRKAVLSLGNDVTKQVMAEEQLKQSYDDIQKLNSYLQTIREEERTGIAREIHDELGQQLTGLKMDTAWLVKKLATEDMAVREKVSDMLLLLDNTIKTVRKISSDLRPGILDDLGLVAALEWQSNEFEKHSGISCWFITSIGDLDIDKNLSTGIFRVYQETLTNIMRHANATQVDTSLVENENYLILTVHDNGKGFDTASIKNKNTLGLLGMKERAGMLNGKLIIETETGQGTTITLEVPLTTTVPQT